MVEENHKSYIALVLKKCVILMLSINNKPSYLVFFNRKPFVHEFFHPFLVSNASMLLHYVLYSSAFYFCCVLENCPATAATDLLIIASVDCLASQFGA